MNTDNFEPPWGSGPEGTVCNPPPEPLREGAVPAAPRAATALLVVEVASMSDAVSCVADMDELQVHVDNLNQIRDRAVDRHTWTDQLQAEWAKANGALARQAEQLQQELENSWVGWLIC